MIAPMPARLVRSILILLLLDLVACKPRSAQPDAATRDARVQPLEAGGRDATAADVRLLDANAAAPPSFFQHTGREAQSCPAGLTAVGCAGWPGVTDGPVWKYTTKQTWKGRSFERTYYVHLPANAAGPAPLVIVLHGGGLGGASMLAFGLWDDLGDPRGQPGITWRKNTATCKAKPTTSALVTYENATGGACLPPAATYGNTLPFVSVFPDGVMDGPKAPALLDRHWEDGRVPSPGFDTDEENRDDVGFIDHIIAHLLADPAVPIDPTAIYVTGASNGGMMAHRLACHLGDPRFPALDRVAAFHVTIAELPEGIHEGQLGRDLCPKIARRAFPLQIVLGTDLDTPQCKPYPCTSPVVSGDGAMPFGEAGKRYQVYSPDSGTVLSGPDTIAFWQAAIPAAAGESGKRIDDLVGFFTKRTTITLSATPARVETLVTSGGGHIIGATRMDFPGVGGGWAFLSRYRRSAAGTLTEVEPTWLTGVY